jgi:hypothetical protein
MRAGFYPPTGELYSAFRPPRSEYGEIPRGISFAFLLGVFRKMREWLSEMICPIIRIVADNR